MRTIYWSRSNVLKTLILPGTLIFLVFCYLLIRSRNEPPQPEKISLTNLNELKAEPHLDLRKFGNFEPPPEPKIDGPGEGGKPYRMAKNMRHYMDVSTGKYNGICVLTSDYIALNRTLPDTRMNECKYWNYPEHMGLNVSVVIVFHNEGFSTLMRNVHQILARTPPEMLHEIILYDDCSQFEDTKERLERTIRRLGNKIKLFRNEMKEGLIRTRNFGAMKATGDVIVFLDAHCEVNRNWLPPLLAPIYKDRRTMTVPFIDKINYRTFQYAPQYGPEELVRGIWEWGLLYKEVDLSRQQVALRKTKSEPYDSPTHAGGLFAISRTYFEELGYYDDGLHVWGGEQYELSFKIWQCGGRIQWVPCSRVGHVYRGPRPPGMRVKDTCKKRNDDPDIIVKNHKRVIEVWWEPKHREYFYTREPDARLLDYGDISKQLEFKRRNNCKSFDWFMKNVAYDQPARFPALPPNVVWGALKSLATNSCIDSFGAGPGGNVGISPCHGTGNQLLRLNTAGQLGLGERCLGIDTSEYVQVLVCHLGRVDGPWKYDKENQQMIHRRLSKCLTVVDENDVKIAECDISDKNQQWTWQNSQLRRR